MVNFLPREAAEEWKPRHKKIRADSALEDRCSENGNPQVRLSACILSGFLMRILPGGITLNAHESPHPPGIRVFAHESTPQHEAKALSASLSTASFQRNQVDLPSEWTDPCRNPRDAQEPSPTPQPKASIFFSQLSQSNFHIHT